MSRPTFSGFVGAPYPSWSTTNLYSGGPLAGTVTKIQPSAGRLQEGWRPQDVPPAQEQGWWQNAVYQWISYLDEPRSDGTKPYPLATRALSKASKSISDKVKFTLGAVASGSFVQQAAPAATDYLVFELDPPHGSRLTTLTVNLRAAAGHGALPATMPTLTVIEVGAFSQTTLGTATDASATVGAYEGVHNILATGLNHTTSRLNRYVAYITGEGGAGAVAGLTIWTVLLDFDQLTEQDPTGA